MLRKMTWTAGVLSSGVLCTSWVWSSCVLNCFPRGYAAGVTLLLGGAGTFFSLFEMDRHQPVHVRPADDPDALACVQPIARLVTTAKLAISAGVFISPLSLLIQVTHTHTHTHAHTRTRARTRTRIYTRTRAQTHVIVRSASAYHCAPPTTVLNRHYNPPFPPIPIPTLRGCALQTIRHPYGSSSVSHRL